MDPGKLFLSYCYISDNCIISQFISIFLSFSYLLLIFDDAFYFNSMMEVIIWKETNCVRMALEVKVDLLDIYD